MFLHQETHEHHETDTSGERREALRALKKANDSLIWGINQSKDPRNKNKPPRYLKKLRAAFEYDYANFEITDLNSLEPLIEQIVREKNFHELGGLCKRLGEVISDLQSSQSDTRHTSATKKPEEELAEIK